MNSETGSMAPTACDPAEQPVTAGIMQAGQPSRSALTVAMLRAAHQLLDTPKVFDDPLALRILGAEHEAQVRRDPAKFDAAFSRVLRAAMVVRSRLAEDELARAMQSGVNQYVVLGAGLDTFAYRHEGQGGQALRVFEVDHPATQAWKRDLLQQSALAVPSSLTFVAVDFEQAILSEELRKAGCRTDLPVFFSWLGVTLYLSHAAIFETLQFVASLPKSSAIVFDYGVAAELLNPMERMGMAHFAKKYAAQGEPWKTTFDPALLADELRATGFSEIEDLGAAELQTRYLADRQDGLRLGGGTRLMLARV
ncbi:class I SAM-dependent methyltransferase [Paraherbaspirillum soli]|uniref:S-adenosyl-L-methionine-dependent methyltransferase n=1 Tax=Paraherbaspirillum soli TaxID=631222 RepID=A0ABW0MBW7_9BURK